MSNIPILDLGSDIEANFDKYMDAIGAVLKSGAFINGPAVKTFEDNIARFLGVNHAVGLNSGTDALTLGLRAAGVGPGDEVITTPFTFFATAESICHCGATPVFVDIEPDTFNMDVTQLESKVTNKTKAILPVHIFGHAVDMEAVLRIAEKHNLRVIEDTAQAFGGEWNGRKLGLIGDVGAYSFFPSKNLGAFGDGGLLVSGSEEIAQMTRKLRNHGGLNKYCNEELGYNSRLDSIQAAILDVKLLSMDQATAGRRLGADRYATLLAGTPQISLPVEKEYAKHVYHQYTVRVTGGNRDDLHEKLAADGIQTMVYYPVPVHKLPVFGDTYAEFPIAEKAATEVLSLPIGPTIDEPTQVKVAEVIKGLCS